MRISKNSSRFDATIVRKRSRSSRGIDPSCASARTRRLKAMSDSSRLIGERSMRSGSGERMTGAPGREESGSFA